MEEFYLKEILLEARHIKWVLFIIMINVGFMAILFIKKSYKTTPNELIKTLSIMWAVLIACIWISIL